MTKTCSIEGCGKPFYGRGWCSMHYQRWFNHGDPEGGGTSRGAPLRYFRETVLAYDGDECLLWPYGQSGAGYAQMSVNGKHEYVHRLVCERAHGAAPTARHQAAHSCGNGHLGCVAYKHLSWKTPKDNTTDKKAHGTQTRGGEHPSARLTEADVRYIRKMRGTIRQSDLAAQFCIHQVHVSDIQLRKCWNWLT